MLSIDYLQYEQSLRVKVEEGKRWLFDPIRKKWLVLQPEEMVRQLVVQFLIQAYSYNSTRIKLEKGLRVNQMYKRCDILVYDMDVQPFLLIECKAPQVKIDEQVFRQIASYNLPLAVPYLMVTNGIFSACCAMNYEQKQFEFIDKIPAYPSRSS